MSRAACGLTLLLAMQGCVFETRCAEGAERIGDACVRVGLDAGEADASDPDAGEPDAPESAVCGDSRTEGSEACDDSANGDVEDGCHDDCTLACNTDAECPGSALGLCSGGATCELPAHRCVPFDPTSCTDTSACTADRCDDAIGCVSTLIDEDGDGQAPTSLGVCGTDCDDGDVTRSMGATELCNNIDDDCDSDVDDGFECVQSTDVPCVACGHAGRRRCGTDCMWSSACFDFLFSELYEGTDPRLTHACGAACGGSTSWCLSIGDSPCHSVSGGPGVELPPGRYQADFRFGYTGSSSSVRFAVYNGASRLGFVDHAATVTFNSTLSVPFMVAACGNSIDVRAESMANSALTFFSVRIRRTGEL